MYFILCGCIYVYVKQINIYGSEHGESIAHIRVEDGVRRGRESTWRAAETPLLAPIRSGPTPRPSDNRNGVIKTGYFGSRKVEILTLRLVSGYVYC